MGRGRRRRRIRDDTDDSDEDIQTICEGIKKEKKEENWRYGNTFIVSYIVFRKTFFEESWHIII